MVKSTIAPEGVIIFTRDGLISLVSDHARAIFNYHGDEMTGLSIDRIIPDGHALLQNHRLNVVYLNHSVTPEENHEITGLTKQQVMFQLEISLNNFKGGSESFVVAFLRAKGSPLEIDPENCPALFLILDDHFAISLINRDGCELLGCADEALHGLNWFENFLPNEDVPELSSAFERSFVAGGFKEYESPLLTLKGEKCFMRWTTSILFDSSGLAVGTLNSGTDSGKVRHTEIDSNHIERIKKLNEHLGLSIKKQTQELVRSLAKVETINRDLQLQIAKRKETEKELIKYQRLYDTMVHNFPDGIIGILNRDMEYVLIDGQDLNEIDLPALGLTGKSLDQNDSSSLAEVTTSQIKKAFDGQSVSFEVEANDRYYNIFAVPLPDTNNAINEVLCVFKNVTEKNRIEGVLLKALEQEKELSELKSRFVTMACHEFKTPLTTILSSTFLLENYAVEDYEREKSVHTSRIRRSVNNLTLILNEFLMLERLDDDKVKRVNTTIDIHRYVGDLLAEVDHLKRPGQVVEHSHTGDQQISIDQHLLWSIIINLVSNAVKYSSTDDKISFTTAAVENRMTIRVKDNGIGIPPDEHDQIFRRFHRARNVINFEGTGLGLHIVEKNVHLLDGTISFTSELNKGTEFIVELPYLTEQADKNPEL